MAVAFEELAGSPVESWGSNGMKADRMFLVAWDDRYDFIIEMLGTGDMFPGTLGAAYPVDGVTAIGAKCKPWTDDAESQSLTDHQTQIQSYTRKAHVTVSYEYQGEDLPDENIDPNTYLTYRADFGTEMFVFKGTDLLKDSNATMPKGHSIEFVKRIPITVYQVTWHRVVDVPWAAIRSKVGKINSDAFLGADTETLLFEGASTEKEWATKNGLDVVRYWAVTYTFSERRVDIDGDGTIRGWNWVFISHPLADAGWEKVNLKDGEPMYQSTDFSSLFVQ